MDVLARLTWLPRLTGLARLLYKLYVFSILQLHESARLTGPARFGEISFFFHRASPFFRAEIPHVIAFVPLKRARSLATHACFGM